MAARAGSHVLVASATVVAHAFVGPTTRSRQCPSPWSRPSDILRARAGPRGGQVPDITSQPQPVRGPLAVPRIRPGPSTQRTQTGGCRPRTGRRLPRVLRQDASGFPGMGRKLRLAPRSARPGAGHLHTCPCLRPRQAVMLSTCRTRESTTARSAAVQPPAPTGRSCCCTPRMDGRPSAVGASSHTPSCSKASRSITVDGTSASRRSHAQAPPSEGHVPGHPVADADRRHSPTGSPAWSVTAADQLIRGSQGDRCSTWNIVGRGSVVSDLLRSGASGSSRRTRPSTRATGGVLVTGSVEPSEGPGPATARWDQSDAWPDP
jgi:hypothetical protein